MVTSWRVRDLLLGNMMTRTTISKAEDAFVKSFPINLRSVIRPITAEYCSSASAFPRQRSTAKMLGGAYIQQSLVQGIHHITQHEQWDDKQVDFASKSTSISWIGMEGRVHCSTTGNIVDEVERKIVRSLAVFDGDCPRKGFHILLLLSHRNQFCIAREHKVDGRKVLQVTLRRRGVYVVDIFGAR